VLSTYLGPLTLGKSDFEAAAGARSDPFFMAAVGLEGGISAARLRQRLDAFAWTTHAPSTPRTRPFWSACRSPVTPLWTGHVALDMDLFAQDNSGTRKEGVRYNYRGFDGYVVMPDYLGQ
jgi:hypothetical protein